MQPQQVGSTNGGSPSVARSAVARSELDRLRATCRRQAHVIDTLGHAVLTLRGGAAALKAENADLRAVYSRVGSRARAGARGRGRVDAGEMLDVSLPLDVRAPGAARLVVTACLRDRVAASVIGDAQLVVSELVSNSVRHSRTGAAGVVIVRVAVTDTIVRLEVADAGRGGVIAPRPADLKGGGGLGLNVVEALSERWGVERIAAGGTRVWAQLPHAPLTAPAFAEAPGDVATARAAGNGRPTSGRAAAQRRQRSGERAP
jgi:serine/threonine-protein kinase RsbW